MFVVTIGDVIAGAALVLIAVGAAAVWAWVAHLDRKRRKRLEREAVKKEN